MSTTTIQVISSTYESTIKYSEPVIVYNASSITGVAAATIGITNITKENIVGITGEGIRHVLDNWNTYKTNNDWTEHLFIKPASEIPTGYPTVMKNQVDAIADLYGALLEKRTEEGTPAISAKFEEKLKWGMENVSTLKELTTSKVMGWIAEGTSNVNFDA